MPKIDPAGKLPPYRQVAEIIAGKIASGEYPRGSHPDRVRTRRQLRDRSLHCPARRRLATRPEPRRNRPHQRLLRPVKLDHGMPFGALGHVAETVFRAVRLRINVEIGAALRQGETCADEQR